MANELVRQSSLYGGTKNIVGSKYSDLVLETLGKVYIKTGKSSRVLNDVFTLLDKYNSLDVEGIKGKVIITESLETLEYPGEGCLIFDTEKHGLYISYDERYILILDSLDVAEDGKGYVKKSGDTMTGTLTIRSKGAPLIVASKQLVRNLNAEYLNGYPSSYFTVKTLNEKISGEWSFNRKTNFNADTLTKGVATFDNKAVFNDNIIAHKDIITVGSLGTPLFASGYLGYGWRLDSDTNMLTVDYLVVRKAMLVFELIVNQIKATNGSLWVTDSCEVKEVHTINFLDVSNISYDKVCKDVWYVPFEGHGVDCFNLKVHTLAKSHLAPASGNLDRITNNTFYDYNYIIKFKSVPMNIAELDFNKINEWDENILDTIQVVNFFPESIDGEWETSLELLSHNKIYNDSLTPKFYSTLQKWSFLDRDFTILELYLYYKYFGLKSEVYQELDENTGELKTIEPSYMRSAYVVKMDDEHYPTLWEQDLIRCLKFEDNNIKYYDAIVAAKFDTYYYLIIVADSVFDKATTVEYDSEGNLVKFEETYNKTQYQKTSQISDETLTEYEKKELAEELRENGTEEINSNPEVILTTIAPKDGLVRVGNFTNVSRQNSVFITSSELDSPYVQTMSGVNRPDYSVLYTSPKFLTRRHQNKDYYYKEVSESQVNNNGIFVYDWILDNEHGQVVSIKTLDGLPLMDEWESYTIDLENKYRKVWYELLDSPNLDCEIEKNLAGAYLSTYNVNVRARFGNLDGIYNELFLENQPHGYGLYGDNVYLTGEFFLSNGKAVAQIGEEVKLEINDKFGKAGLYILDINNDGKPDIILSAEQIHILTSQGLKTALFTNGRIEAKLLRVTDLEAASLYYYETKDGNKYYYSSSDTLELVMASNGHVISHCVTDSLGNVMTYVDKTHPFVSISSDDGLLEARNAKLYGGMLELESTDKSTLVTVGVPENEDGSIAYAGMTISKNVGTESVEWLPVAYYSGSVNNSPNKNYKSESVQVNATSPFLKSMNLNTTVYGGQEDINMQSPTVETTDSFDLSETFTVTKNTQISVSVLIGNQTSVYADYYLRNTALYCGISVVNTSNNRQYSLCGFAPYIYYNNYNSYRDFLIGKSYYGSANIPEGTYKLKAILTLHSEVYTDMIKDSPSHSEFYLSASGTIHLSKVSVKILSNEFMTNYMGNGITMGFNELNYFSSYFYNTDYESSKYLVIDFLSNGAGMKYENGKTYQYFNGYLVKMPIPIYSGTIKVLANRHTSGGLDYSGYALNCLQIPIVKSYKRWLWEVDNGGMPTGHTRNKLYADGLDNDHPQTHGDFVIDFLGLEAYQNIDFSSDNVLVNLTGSPSFGKKDALDSHRIYGTLYARSSKLLRVWLSDDASNNDGNCFVTIYYIP